MNRSEFQQTHYKAGFLRALDDFNIERVAFYGIRFLNSRSYQFNPLTIESDMVAYTTVLGAIGTLTSRALMNIFPVQKIYSGDNNWKDYFSTIEAVQKNGVDQIIKEPFDFLWDYTNQETRKFLVHYMSLLNDIHQLQGHPDMIAEFFGIKSID